ncbi:MAG TPA: SDR family NAD(P)-dependent oxidoreductase [Dehalococcoidales bacterium]|nr:SDR family NAD(P)-dependent oxidoreductase [Dehalococcoidales bacterium]
MKLENKVAIVTGAGQGIGEVIAKKLASEGASVAVCDVNFETAQHVVDEITGNGGNALALQADVSKKAGAQKMVKDTIDYFRALHILVNNAGIVRYAPIPELKEEDWDAVMDVDLKGVFLCTQAVLPYLIAQKYGKIVNISSAAAIGCLSEGQSAYAAAKVGVVQFTKATALEAGPYGINVNSIAPGLIIVPSRFLRDKEQAEARIEVRRKATALRRVGYPEDIANAALFLVSEDAGFISGQDIAVNGGRMDRM